MLFKCLVASSMLISLSSIATPIDTARSSCGFIVRELLAEKAAAPSFGEDAKDLLAFFAVKWDGTLLPTIWRDVIHIEGVESTRLPPVTETQKLIRWVESVTSATSGQTLPELRGRREQYQFAVNKLSREFLKTRSITDTEIVTRVNRLENLKKTSRLTWSNPREIERVEASLNAAMLERYHRSIHLTALLSAILKIDGVEFEVREVASNFGAYVAALPKIFIKTDGMTDLNRFAGALAKNRRGPIVLIVQPDRALLNELGSWNWSARDLSFSIEEIASGQYLRGPVIGHEYLHLLVDEAIEKDLNLGFWNFSAMAHANATLPVPVTGNYALEQNYSELATFNFDILRYFEELERSVTSRKLTQETFDGLVKEVRLRSLIASQITHRTYLTSQQALRALESATDHGLISNSERLEIAELSIGPEFTGNAHIDYVLHILLPPGLRPEGAADLPLGDPRARIVKNWIQSSLEKFTEISGSYALQLKDQTTFLDRYAAPGAFINMDPDEVAKIIQRGLDLEAPVPLRSFADFARFPRAAPPER